jgi:hypothetical protein
MTRKSEFLVFSVILLAVGYLQYLRRIANGYKLSRRGKVLYLVTMVVFTGGVMLMLEICGISNILSFLVGLFVAVSSEHIARLFNVVGNNFNIIVGKVLKKYTGVDLSNELKDDGDQDDN